MAQIPVNDNTYSRLSLTKAKAVISKNGACVTWEDVISAMEDVIEKHPSDFINAVKDKAGKVRMSSETRNKKQESIMED